MTTSTSPTDVVSARIARDVLARAAALDAARAEGVSVAHLREAAVEAGIAPAAVDRALSEVRGRVDGGDPAPRWVRLALFGVADRRGALVFYWLFVVMSLAMPASLLFLGGPATRGQRLLGAAVLGLWTVLSAWVTARAIKWADRHGWDRVP